MATYIRIINVILIRLYNIFCSFSRLNKHISTNLFYNNHLAHFVLAIPYSHCYYSIACNEAKETMKKLSGIWGENRSDRSRSWSLSTANGEDMFSPYKTILQVKSATHLCLIVVMASCIAWPASTAFAGEKKKTTAKSETPAAGKPAKTTKKPSSVPRRVTTPRTKASPTQRTEVTTPRVVTTSRPSTQTYRRPTKAAVQPKRKTSPPASPRLQTKPEPRNGAALGKPERRPPPRGRPDRSPKPTVEEREPLPHPRQRLDQPPRPKLEEQEPLPHPRHKLDDDSNTGGKERRKPPPDDPPPGRREHKPRFPYEGGFDPQPRIGGYVDYEICVTCAYYACRCDWYYDDAIYDEYYYDEYVYYEPTAILNTLETLNFVMTSGAIFANGIMISREQRSPAAAFFGYAFGASSLLLGASGKTSHPFATMLFGAASILLATWNLQMPDDSLQSSDLWHDGSYQSRGASPLAGVTFSF